MGRLTDRLKSYDEKPIPKSIEEVEQVTTQIIKPIQKPTPATANHTHVTLSGSPIDIHDIEKFLVYKTSPVMIKNINRINSVEIMEDIINYSKKRLNIKFNFKTVLIIMLLIGLIIGGILMVFYMPELTNIFKNIMGGFGGIM